MEESVKARTKGEAGAAKTLCMPFEQDTLPMVSNTLPEGNIFLSSGSFWWISCMKDKLCCNLNLAITDFFVPGHLFRNQVFRIRQTCEEMGFVGSQLLIW